MSVSARKIALLSSLYVAQGLPYGFQAVALPAYLRAQHVSLTGIGFLGLLALPWMTKAFVAPFVDRYASPRFGRRRSWIVPMQAGLVLSCAAAAFVDPTAHLAILLALVFLMNLFASTQDIAVDGLAVDLLAGGELGAGNAAQVVGYKVGMLTGGGLLVYASARLGVGWHGLFLAMAAMVGAVLVVALLYREPPARAEPARETLPHVLRALGAALRVPGTAWLIALIGTYKIGETIVEVMFKPFLVDVGYAPSTIALYLGTYGMVASIAGSLAGGVLAARVRLERAIAAALILRTASLAGNWLCARGGGIPEGVTVIAVTCVEHVFVGLLTTVMFAFMMSRIDRRIAATHYTLLASVEVLGKSPAAWISGPLATHAGYANTFAIGLVISIAFLALLFSPAMSKRLP